MLPLSLPPIAITYVASSIRVRLPRLASISEDTVKNNSNKENIKNISFQPIESKNHK
jgi:hypothetical protein